MRADAFITLNVVQPVRRLFPPKGRRVPILMYHSIADDLDDAQRPYFRTVTSPAVFARQIELLRADGYTAITLSEAVRLLEASDG